MTRRGGLALARSAALARTVALACGAALALVACRTAPPAAPGWAPLPTGDPRVLGCAAALSASAEARHGLRASARVRSEGPEGSAVSNQLVLAERPARLRVEVIGLLAQRVLVLATDGVGYELYRAETGAVERGELHPGVLEEVAGLPLTPEAAVSLLLAGPRPPEGEAEHAALDATGAVRLAWPDETFECDAEGRVRALDFHPRGHAVLHARWSDWQGVARGEFPHRLELALPESEARWSLELRQVELDPALDPALFRLGLGAR